MGNENIVYRIDLPSDVDVEGYHNLKLSGDTVATTKPGAVSQFLCGQDLAVGRLAVSALRKKHGSLEGFAREPGELRVEEVSLDSIGVYQTEQDLREGNRMNREELRLASVYELTRRLAGDDGVTELVGPKIDPNPLHNYLESARALPGVL